MGFYEAFWRISDANQQISHTEPYLFFIHCGFWMERGVAAFYVGPPMPVPQYIIRGIDT